MDKLSFLLNEALGYDSKREYKKSNQIDFLIKKMLKVSQTTKDYLEDEEFRSFIESIGTQEDVDDHELYTKMYGEEFPTADNPQGIQELIKTLYLERENASELFNEMMFKQNPSEEEAKYTQALSDQINKIDEEINQLKAKLENNNPNGQQ